LSSRQEDLTSGRSSSSSSLSSIRGFLLDMDGTIYLGDRLLPGASEFIARCRSTGRRVLFLTNNSSRSAVEYAQKLNALGIAASEDDILTSGEATVSYLKAAGFGSRVYLLGTKPLQDEFSRARFEFDSERPDVVVLGFDTDLTYDRLRRACDLIRRGVPFIATHPDINCPTESGPIPDCGSIIAAIRESTHRTPKVIGKPNPEMIDSAMRKIGVRRQETAMVGDRLYTDIAMALSAQIMGILVLSGETQQSDLKESRYTPDLVVDCIGDLVGLL
jgi:HAD superfamily hydrolase (TIGR01457 family)